MPSVMTGLEYGQLAWCCKSAKSYPPLLHAAQVKLSARNGPVRDQDRFQRKVKFILIIIGAFAIAAYLVAIPGQEEDVVHVDMSSSITNALTNAVLDIEMAEEIQLEQKEEKLFSTKMLQVEEQMKHDLSNAVQNLQ